MASVTIIVEKKMRDSSQEKLLLTNTECDHNGRDEDEAIWSREVVTYQY